jgi:hypothetical protein
MIYGWCIFLAYYSVAGLLFASARKWGIDGFRKITLYCDCARVAMVGTTLWPGGKILL